MIKIVFFSDTHLGIDMTTKPKKERRRRGPDYFRNFEAVLAHAVNVEADLIIHGGDMFDKPDLHPAIVEMAYKKLFNTAEQGIPIVICPGNHECAVLPPSLYLNHSNIYVYRNPQVFSFAFNNRHLEIAGFPYFRKTVRNAFPKFCKQLANQLKRRNAFRILLMHQAIEGAVVGPQKYMFRHAADVVQKKDIPTYYHLVLAGHIHPTQQLQTPRGTEVLYAGSTERTAFAERDEVKGFYEIAIMPDNQYQHTFIPLYTRPMELVELDKENYTTESIKKALKQAIANFDPNAIVQIRLKNSNFLSLLNVRLLDEVFPVTMNYEVAGARRFK